jgi:hypothetical protein
MSFAAITTFIEIDGTGKYQNSKVGSLLGVPYLSFIYQGAAKNRTGDNIESALVLSANQISMNAVRDAVANQRKVSVTTALMSDDFSSKQRDLTIEHWIAASMSYDTETIEVLLSSAIDAVGAITPSRVLTRLLVGDLPVSGSIYNR